MKRAMCERTGQHRDKARNWGKQSESPQETSSCLDHVSLGADHEMDRDESENAGYSLVIYSRLILLDSSYWQYVQIEGS